MRGLLSPTGLWLFWVLVVPLVSYSDPQPRRLHPGGFLDAFNDANIAGTAAQVADQGRADFFFAWIRIPVEERPGGDQNSRRTKAALNAAGVDHGFLDGAEPLIACQAFNRDDLGSVTFRRQHHAAIHRFPIQQHGAGATLPAEQPFFVPVSARLSRNMRIRVMFEGTRTCSSPH